MSGEPTVITVESYKNDPEHTALADRIIAASKFKRDQVFKITQGGEDVWVVDAYVHDRSGRPKLNAVRSGVKTDSQVVTL